MLTEAATTEMGSDGINDKLRDKIKAKRAHDGLEEIPDDLFTKKPKHDLTEEEKQRIMERRQRNKEAAEKSRKKKKDEFEKLQQENDQLQQDKCELAAMITKQKTDFETLSLENTKLRAKMDHLLRWIATRTKEFGLDKHRSKEIEQDKLLSELDSTSPILHSDPTLQHTVRVNHVTKEDLPVQRSPTLTAAPGKQSPTREEVHAMRGASPRLQTPWLVDQTTAAEEQAKQPVEEDDVQIVDVENEEMVVEIPQSSEEQFLYLPKDTVLIVHNQSGDQITAVTAPDMDVHSPQAAPQASAEIAGSISNAMAVLNGEGNDDLPAQTATSIAAATKAPAPTAQESIVSTTTTTANNEHVSREALMNFVEALMKIGVKFDTSSLQTLAKASDTFTVPVKPATVSKKSDEKLNKAPRDHDYLPTTFTPGKNGSSILAH